MYALRFVVFGVFIPQRFPIPLFWPKTFAEFDLSVDNSSFTSLKYYQNLKLRALWPHNVIEY